MYRILPETGEVLVPHLFEDGTYGAADPAHGSKRHHIANRVVARNLDELRSYYLKRWPIWMSIRGTRDRRLISRGIVDAPVPDGATPRTTENRARPTATTTRPSTKKSALLKPSIAASPMPVEVSDSSDFLQLLGSMSASEISAEIEKPHRLLMARHVHRGEKGGSKRLDIVYAPFEHVNKGADIVIVGITPGRQQMREAIIEAHRAISDGLQRDDVLALAKVHASFAGAMRKNLVKMLDAVGLNDWLGIESTESLWNTDSHRAHFTSTIRFPTFVEDEDYNGRNPNLGDVPFLFRKARQWLKEELVQFPDAIIVPLGDVVSDAVVRIGREARISPDRILSGMPHASPAANGYISRFLGEKGEHGEYRDRFRDISGKLKGLPGPSSAIVP